MEWTDLAAYVGAHNDDQAFLEDALNVATFLVNKKVGTVDVPTVVLEDWIFKVAAALWEQKNAPNGEAVFNDPTPSGVRIFRDPMQAVYPSMRMYLGYGV